MLADALGHATGRKFARTPGAAVHGGSIHRCVRWETDRGAAFYAAYESAWPLDAGAGTRRTLYNLYHVLNHYNLFGGGYGAQAAAMIDRLLAEL